MVFRIRSSHFAMWLYAIADFPRRCAASLRIYCGMSNEGWSVPGFATDRRQAGKAAAAAANECSLHNCIAEELQSMQWLAHALHPQ